MVLKDIPCKKDILLDDQLMYNGSCQQIYLTRYSSATDELDRYYLRVGVMKDDEFCKQAYAYFYLDDEKMESKLIGVFVGDEYRNNGLASLLISTWILFSMNYGYANLKTHYKQRKPFLLYLLKKFDFDAESDHLNSNKGKIHICKLLDRLDKYLIFDNKHEEECFSNSHIKDSDGYRLCDFYTPGIEVLDSVILRTPYVLEKNEAAYTKALTIYDKHRR